MTMNRRYAGKIDRARLVAAGMATAALLGVGEAAIARPRTSAELVQPEAASVLAPAQRGISLGQATAMAQSQFPGRVVRAAT
ncbi:MAG TPA: hypothetical protein VIQ99_07155, partial [Gammaproteobacteria bacterium]